MDYLKLGIVGVVLTLVLGVWWKVSSVISNLENTIVTKDTRITELTESLDRCNVKLVLSDANSRELKRSLDVVNEDMSKLDKEHSKAMKELEVWKLKPLEIKYIEKVSKIVTNPKYDTDSCEEGKKLNEEISKLKYEEL